MFRKRLIFAMPMLLVIVVLLAGCNQDRGHISVVHIDDGIQIHHGHVTLHAPSVPDAVITKAGDLKIGGKPIQVTANQHQQLRQYYQQAVAVEQQGIAVGKAGASMAGGTIGDVTKNLFSGHPDRIDADVNKRKDQLLSKVAGICDSLGSLQETQDTLRAGIPAFKPYARIEASDVAQCRRGVKDGRENS